MGYKAIRLSMPAASRLSLAPTINSWAVQSKHLANITDNVFRTDLSRGGFYFTDSAVQSEGTVDPARQRNDARINLAQNIRTLSSRRSTLRNQSIKVLDVSILKNFALTESVKLQLRVEALNSFNRPHFSTPDLNPRNTTFGRVTNTTLVVLPREFQLGLKLLF